MKLRQKGTRVAAAEMAEDILESDPKTVASGKRERRMTKIRIPISAIKLSRNGLDDPSNRPRAMRTRKMRTNKNI